MLMSYKIKIQNLVFGCVTIFKLVNSFKKKEIIQCDQFMVVLIFYYVI